MRGSSTARGSIRRRLSSGSTRLCILKQLILLAQVCYSLVLKVKDQGKNYCMCKSYYLLGTTVRKGEKDTRGKGKE
jgi:hypothetical protein